MSWIKRRDHVPDGFELIDPCKELVSNIAENDGFPLSKYISTVSDGKFPSFFLLLPGLGRERPACPNY